MPTIRPFSVREVVVRNILSWFQRSVIPSMQIEYSGLCRGWQSGIFIFVKSGGQISSISSVFFLICIPALEIYSYHLVFLPSCSGVLHVHSFVNNDMHFTRMSPDCNNAVSLQNFSGSLIVIQAANT